MFTLLRDVPRKGLELLGSTQESHGKQHSKIGTGGLTPEGPLSRRSPQFAKWTGSGEHFAFMAQPAAGLANYATLATALAPLLAGGAEEAQATMAHAVQASEAAVADVWRRKLGFPASAAGRQAAEILWPVLHGLLEATPPDWTVL